MKVILNATVPKVGKQGTIVTVADGFARNYLFPRGLAVVADKAQIASLERRQARTAAKVAEGKAAAEALKGELDGKEVRLEGKVGAAAGKLFGAITAQDIADAIKAQLKHDIEKRRVALIDPIKRLGTHDVHLDLHNEVDAIVKVTVFDPAAPVEAEAVEEVQEDSAEAETATV